MVWGINLSKAQVNSWGLSRHHLAKRARKGQIENVVSGLCGVQAQRKSSLTEVTVKPFRNLSSARKQLVKEEAASFGEFMGTKVEVYYSIVNSA